MSSVPPPPPPPPPAPSAPPLRTPHPRATTALVLGILGMVLCCVLAPFAWSVGSRAVREIDADPQRWDGRGQAQAGRILGIVGTVLAAIVVVALVLLGFVGAFSTVLFRTADTPAPVVTTAPAPSSSPTPAPEPALTDADREAILRFAATAAEQITSRDPDRYDAEVDEAAALMTPSYATTYRSTADGIRAQFLSQHATIRAVVAADGVVGARPDRAQVLVFLNQTTTRDGAPDDTVIASTVVLDLARDGDGDGWLVDGLTTGGDTDAPTLIAETAPERRAVLDAAQATVLALTNFDYRDPGTSADEVLAHATGTFAKQYEAGRVQLEKLAADARTTMTSTVLAAGLTALDGDTATVVVATKGSVTNRAGGGQPQQRDYRLRLTLERVDGTWLTSDLEYVAAG